MVLVTLDACATGFAYLWNETPVLGTEALAIYADNAAHLPAGANAIHHFLTAIFQKVYIY